MQQSDGRYNNAAICSHCPNALFVLRKGVKDLRPSERNASEKTKVFTSCLSQLPSSPEGTQQAAQHAHPNTSPWHIGIGASCPPSASGPRAHLQLRNFGASCPPCRNLNTLDRKLPKVVHQNHRESRTLRVHQRTQRDLDTILARVLGIHRCRKHGHL